MQSPKIETRKVTYSDGKTEFEGFLALPATPKAGVLIFHEWFGAGEYVEKRAQQLAELGYAGFTADMYGKGKRAKNREEAVEYMMTCVNDRKLLRQRARAALNFFKDQPQVKGKPIAAIGYCFGGLCAIEMARAGMDLAGVVSFHGALETNM